METIYQLILVTSDFFDTFFNIQGFCWCTLSPSGWVITSIDVRKIKLRRQAGHACCIYFCINWLFLYSMTYGNICLYHDQLLLEWLDVFDTLCNLFWIIHVYCHNSFRRRLVVIVIFIKKRKRKLTYHQQRILYSICTSFGCLKTK